MRENALRSSRFDGMMMDSLIIGFHTLRIETPGGRIAGQANRMNKLLI